MPIDQIAPEDIASFLKELTATEVKFGMKNSLNIFEAAGLERQETKNSRMLAFLLDPSKAHCLGAEVFKKLVLANYSSISSPKISPTKLILDSCGDLFIECEWKRIDVLAYSEKMKLVVAIENKIDAKQSEKQLQRYADILKNDEKFTSYSKLLLYLTVDGEEPDDDRWQSMQHEDVFGYVKEAYDDAKTAGAITLEADFFVKNYIDFLRRNIVSNPLLEDECRLIYQRHKVLLDAIINFVGIRNSVFEPSDKFVEKTGTTILFKNALNLVYLPTAWIDILPENTLAGDGRWWGQKRPVLFWFALLGERTENPRLRLHFEVGPMKDQEKRTKLIQELRSKMNVNLDNRITATYTRVRTETIRVDLEENNLEARMIDYLHKNFEPYLEEITKVLEKTFKSKE